MALNYAVSCLISKCGIFNLLNKARHVMHCIFRTESGAGHTVFLYLSISEPFYNKIPQIRDSYILLWQTDNFIIDVPFGKTDGVTKAVFVAKAILVQSLLFATYLLHSTILSRLH